MPSGPTLGGGRSAAQEAGQAQLSPPRPDTPPARSAPLESSPCIHTSLPWDLPARGCVLTLDERWSHAGPLGGRWSSGGFGLTLAPTPHWTLETRCLCQGPGLFSLSSVTWTPALVPGSGALGLLSTSGPTSHLLAPDRVLTGVRRHAGTAGTLRGGSRQLQERPSRWWVRGGQAPVC